MASETLMPYHRYPNRGSRPPGRRPASARKR